MICKYEIFDVLRIYAIAFCITYNKPLLIYCLINKKEVKVFANSKPWINGEMKKILNDKKKAFLSGDKLKVKELEKEFRWKNKKSQREYKDKVQAKLIEGNGKGAWDGLNSMMGRKVQKKNIVCDDPMVFSNDLNRFYSRFDDKVLQKK